MTFTRTATIAGSRPGQEAAHRSPSALATTGTAEAAPSAGPDAGFWPPVVRDTIRCSAAGKGRRGIVDARQHSPVEPEAVAGARATAGSCVIVINAAPVRVAT